MDVAVMFALVGCGWIGPSERDARWDLDGDGYERPVDCDDADPHVSPGAVERCDPDHVDEDCDGQADDDDPDRVGATRWCADPDGDGIGDPATAVVACAAPDGWTAVCEGSPPDTGAPSTCGPVEVRFTLDATAEQGGAPVALDASDSAGDGLTLLVRWGDGAVEPLTGLAGAHVYTGAGWLGVRVEGTDRCGATAAAERWIAVGAPGQRWLVTTSDDERDGEVAGAGWLGAGLSLAEALTLAASTDGPQVIGFDPALATVRVGPGLGPVSDAGGIVAGAVTVDGAAGGAVVVSGDGAVVSGLTLSGFTDPSGAVQLTGAGAHGADLRIVGSAVGARLDGDGATLSGGSVRGSSGVQVDVRRRGVVLGVSVTDGADDGVVIDKFADGSVLAMCTVSGHAGDGLWIAASNVTVSDLTATEDANGIVLDAKADDVVLRNVLLAFSAGWGLDAAPESLAAGSPDHGLWFGNGAGTCSGCDPGAGAIEADPLLTDGVPGPGSPAIDAGSTATSFDRNGAAPGSWWGAAPELGAVEVP